MNLYEISALLTLNTKGYEDGLDSSQEKTNSFGTSVKNGLATAAKVGAAAIGAASTAAVSFAKSSVEAGKDFDSAMSQVAATMGYSMEELNDDGSEGAQTLEKLRTFAQQMGSTTAFSATEAAEALNYMALAGYSSEQAIDMLPTVLNLAAAGGMDLAAASDMVTDSQTALGLSFDQTYDMVDRMATMASKSNTSVEQLGEAFLTVGANARGLKGGTTELSTMLGVLADNGIKGSEAGTHLRNILLSMTPSSDAAAAAFEELGLEAYDANGELRPLTEIFGDLSEAMDGMSDQRKTEMLSAMFNKTDLAAVNALLGTSAERYAELYSAAVNAGGAAQDMADVQLDNLEGDITLFKSALEGAQIAVSDQLTPALRDFVQFGSDGLSSLTAAFNEGGLTGAMSAMGTIISDAIAMIIEQLPTMLDAGMQLLGALGQGIMDNLPMMLQTAMDLVTSFANYITENLPEMIPAAINTILSLVETLTNPESLGNMISAAIDLIIALAEGLIDAIPEIVDKIPTIISNITLALLRATPKMIEAGAKLFLALIRNLPAVIIQIVTALPRIIGDIVTYFKNPKNLQEFANVGMQLMAGLGDGIVSSIGSLVQKAAQAAQSLINNVKGVFGIHSPSKVFAGIGGFLMEGLENGIDDGAKDAVKSAVNASEDIIDAMTLDTDANGGFTADLNNPSNIVVQVYGAEGQNVEELAEIVSERMASAYSRGRAVFA